MSRLGEVSFKSVEISAKSIRTEGVVHELAVTRGSHKTSSFKLFHVVRERCGTDPDELAHHCTGRRIFTGAELFENLVAARIRDGACDQVHLLFGEVDGLSGGGHADWMRMFLLLTLQQSTNGVMWLFSISPIAERPAGCRARCECLWRALRQDLHVAERDANVCGVLCVKTRRWLAQAIVLVQATCRSLHFA